MKPKTILIITLPNVQAMITGVCRIDRAHDLTTLEYTDGTRESATITQARWTELYPPDGDVFRIISEVQSKRKTKP